MFRIRRGHSSISTVLGIVLLVVGLAVGGGIGYAATFSSITSSNVLSSLTGTVNIGVLDDLTDGLSGEGIKINFTAHQAVTDINNYLQGTPYAGKVKFNVVVENYNLDPTVAATDLATFKSQGITVVVGPLNSGAAGAILTSADSDQIVLISPSSTSPALGIPNDYLFRTAPTDINQGKADARIMYSNGARYLIQVFRDDTYGNGLSNYTKSDFIADGGHVIDSIPYDVSTSDFTSILSKLNTDYSTALSASNANGNKTAVAIQMIAFDEGATLLQQAQKSYSALLSTPQPWYGTDGEEGEQVFTNTTNAMVTSEVRLPSTVFGYTNSSKTQTLCSQLFTAIHQTCDSYPLGAYDDVWIAALSLLQCGTNSGSCVQKVLTSVADNYYGVTGWTALDANGDRAFGDFLIYCITGPTTNLAWDVCGSWSQLSDSVTWTANPL